MNNINEVRRYDCCGKIIPPEALNELNGYTSYITPHPANNRGNPKFSHHHPFDMIHGMVIFNIQRETESGAKKVVLTQEFNEKRLQTICPECKISLLRYCIEYVKNHEMPLMQK